MKKFFCLIIIVLILIFIVIICFSNNKLSEANELNIQNSSFENIIENTTSKNIIISENIIPSEEDTSTKTIKYEFTSADSFAIQGNPGILKIFDFTNTKIEFEYNHGWNFAESTIDRKILGIAEIIGENLYEFKENIDGHKYSITFKVSEEMVTLSEYIDGNLLSIINLWS